MNTPRKTKKVASQQTAADSEFEAQMAVAREIMRKDREILRALAK